MSDDQVDIVDIHVDDKSDFKTIFEGEGDIPSNSMALHSRVAPV